MATYTYKGTKITGTSTSGKIFKKSGIKKAKKGQTYLNTSTGHVYKCTDDGDKGKADEAKWKYLRTDVVKKPSVAVSNLGAPVRGANGSYDMTAEWKIPSAMTDKKKGNRATSIDISWFLGIKGKDPKKVIHVGNVSTKKSKINLNSLKIGKKTWKRNQFYPFKGKPLLKYVTVKVVSKNSKGAGASAKKRRKFSKPKAPSISAGTFNDVGEVSFTINTDAGNGYRERHDTKYTLKVYYSSSGKTNTIIPNKNKTGDNKTGITTATSKTIKFDDKSYAARSYEDYAKVVVTAIARGFAGDSKTTERTFYISYPAQAEIVSYSLSGKTSADKCTLTIKTNSTVEHPVDRVKLEYLANCEYADASQIPGDAGWQQTDIIDNATCTAMAVPVADLMPDSGNHTWVRLKTYHANETVLHRYSNYMRIADLETPAATATDDKITIVSAVAGEDGESAVVNLAWDDGTPVSTGTEVSWSEDENSWKSTEDPDKYEFEWEDKTSEGQPIPVTKDGVTYPHSATIRIKGLDTGTLYYVRARRYNEGDQTTFSEYSNVATVLTSEKPESVVATADRYISKGSGLNIYWTFSGNGIQTAWQITTPDENTVILDGVGATASTQIPADALEKVAENGSVKYVVQVSTGSGWVKTEEKEVTIIDPPTLTVNAPTTMDIQPYEFTAVASVPSDLIVIVTSQGATGQFPQGILNQTAGDTIHSDVYSPDWIAGYVLSSDTEYLDKKYFTRDGDVFTEVEVSPVYELTSDTTVDSTKRYYIYDGENYIRIEPSVDDNPSEQGWYESVNPANPSQEGWYEETEGVSATVTLPPNLDFWDLGSYTLEATAVDQQTDLRSVEQVSNFTVAWRNQAVTPESKTVYVLSADTSVDENKNYYTYDGETQTYIVIVDVVGDEDPSALGWYEENVTRYVTITPLDYVDDNGFHHQAAQIDLTPPEGSSETDVYDIYRMTGDGPRLIGESFPLTYTAVDEYAPFGEDMTNEYRIALRTVDGDVAFSDFEYVLSGEGIRVDWADGFVEYPYGVSIEDGYSKDVEIRSHMDGTINGYWNEGVRRKGSLSTDMIKIIQAADVDATRRLARYTGPAFVRTKVGTAFEADVQITKLSEKNLAFMSIAIDAEEIDLTDEFMLPVPDVLEDAPEGGGE